MILLGKVVLGMAGLGLAGASLLCSEGFVQVKVMEEGPQGHHIDVIAPAMLAPIAVRLAPRNEWAQAAWQIQPSLPVIRAALAGLRGTGDVVFVEVNERGEHVHVAKSGDSMVVDVDDAGETVHVSAPIRALSSTVEEIAARASPQEYESTAPRQR